MKCYAESILMQYLYVTHAVMSFLVCPSDHLSHLEYTFCCCWDPFIYITNLKALWCKGADYLPLSITSTSLCTVISPRLPPVCLSKKQMLLNPKPYRIFFDTSADHQVLFFHELTVFYTITSVIGAGTRSVWGRQQSWSVPDSCTRAGRGACWRTASCSGEKMRQQTEMLQPIFWNHTFFDSVSLFCVFVSIPQQKPWCTQW